METMDTVVEVLASGTTLMETVDTVVESAVIVLRTVAAGNVRSIVFAGCVFSTVIVESRVSVAGGKVCAGAVTVSVTSIDCMTVVAAACWAREDEDAEPELPSTATTEYVAARLCTKTSLGWKGKDSARRWREDNKTNLEGRLESMFPRRRERWDLSSSRWILQVEGGEEE